MPTIKPSTTLEHAFSPVKSSPPAIRIAPSNSMIHHNGPGALPHKVIVTYKNIERSPYGVSPAYRVLSPQLLLRKFDQVRACLAGPLGMPTSQREVALRLLRLWAYYGQVYPKESQVTELPGCSKATFWRTIKMLQGLGLVHVINRYVLRPHAQISNLYRLDRLVLLLARYISEHGHAFYEHQLQPYLAMPGRQFWSQIYSTPEARAGPGELAF